MKLAILVLSTTAVDEYGDYEEMTNCVRETWGKEIPENVSVYYNYGLIPGHTHNPNEGENVLDGDKIICGVNDTYELITKKTLEAFDYIATHLTEYDYIFRCCNGSYIHVENLVNFLQEKPKTQFYAGVTGVHNNVPFASGAGFILSKDMVKLLADNKEAILNDPDIAVHGQIDDIIIGYFLHKQGITARNIASRIDIGDLPHNKHEVFNLTCLYKNEYHYHLRQNIEGMKYLHDLFLNKRYCD